MSKITNNQTMDEYYFMDDYEIQEQFNVKNDRSERKTVQKFRNYNQEKVNGNKKTNKRQN